MPRKLRFYLPGVPAHVIKRGNNRQPVFFDDTDYRVYKRWLKEGCERHECVIHAYVLMTNHVHLLVTPQKSDSIGRLFQFLGRRYVPYINRKYGRSGTLWEGRHKGSLICESDYLMACSRYIELNPVRAGMVPSPAHYRWSSYRANALGEVDCLVKPQQLYEALGQSASTRQRAYRGLFSEAGYPDQLHQIRAAVQTGTPLGNAWFRLQVEEQLNQKVGQPRRGRPKKQEDRKR